MKDCKIAFIRSDHGGGFTNIEFNMFCDEYDTLHNSSTPRTPQQNGVIERKNRSLEELARTLLNDSKLSKYFRSDVVSTACYVLNSVFVRPILKKTHCELF